MKYVAYFLVGLGYATNMPPVSEEAPFSEEVVFFGRVAAWPGAVGIIISRELKEAPND